MLEKLREQVDEQLKRDPACRNSDIALMIAIWQEYYPQRIREGMIRIVDLYDLPREDNIKRIRAKFQEEALDRIDKGKIKGDEMFYLPTSAEVAKQRKINASIWEKALGYFKRPIPQSEQLPHPIGHLGFTKIDENTFIIEGARGIKYNINHRIDLDRWECECPDYKYRCEYGSFSKDCKHIKEVKSYLDNLEKAKAAEKQNNLF